MLVRRMPSVADVVRRRGVDRWSVFGPRVRLFEAVGDRVLKAQGRAFADGGLPGIGPVPLAGSFKEDGVEACLDGVE
jgi:hypothetical protein